MTNWMVCVLYQALLVARWMWDIFSTTLPQCRRSHYHCHYTSHILYDVSLNDLLPFTQFGFKLVSLSFSKLQSLYNSFSENHATNPNSNQYKLTTIILDIVLHKLFKPVGFRKDEPNKDSFLKFRLPTRTFCHWPRKIWRYQLGNQKCELNKDRQYNGQKKKNKQ